MGQRRKHDEEGKKRDQGEVGEVARMDKAIRIDADRDAFDDVERARMAPVPFLMLRAPFGRFG